MCSCVSISTITAILTCWSRRFRQPVARKQCAKYSHIVHMCAHTWIDFPNFPNGHRDRISKFVQRLKLRYTIIYRRNRPHLSTLSEKMLQFTFGPQSEVSSNCLLTTIIVVSSPFGLAEMLQHAEHPSFRLRKLVNTLDSRTNRTRSGTLSDHTGVQWNQRHWRWVSFLTTQQRLSTSDWEHLFGGGTYCIHQYSELLLSGLLPCGVEAAIQRNKWLYWNETAFMQAWTNNIKQG